MTNHLPTAPGINKMPNFEDFIPQRIPGLNIGDTVVSFGGSEPKTGIVRWIGFRMNYFDNRIKAWVEMDEYIRNDSYEQYLAPKFCCSPRRGKFLSVAELILFQDYLPLSPATEYPNPDSFSNSQSPQIPERNSTLKRTQSNYERPPDIGWNFQQPATNPTYYDPSPVRQPISNSHEIRPNLTKLPPDDRVLPVVQSQNRHDWEWESFDISDPVPNLSTSKTDYPQSMVAATGYNSINTNPPTNAVLPSQPRPNSTNLFVQSPETERQVPPVQIPTSPKNTIQRPRPTLVPVDIVSEALSPKSQVKPRPKSLPQSPMLYQQELASVLGAKLKSREAIDWQNLTKNKRSGAQGTHNNDMHSITRPQLRKPSLNYSKSSSAQRPHTLPNLLQNREKLRRYTQEQQADFNTGFESDDVFNPYQDISVPSSSKPNESVQVTTKLSFSKPDVAVEIGSSPRHNLPIKTDINPDSSRTRLTIKANEMLNNQPKKPDVSTKPKLLPKPRRLARPKSIPAAFIYPKLPLDSQQPLEQLTRSLSISNYEPDPLPVVNTASYDIPNSKDEDVDNWLPPPPPPPLMSDTDMYNYSDYMPPPPPPISEICQEDEDFQLPPPPPPLPEEVVQSGTNLNLTTEPDLNNNEMHSPHPPMNYRKGPVTGDLLREIQMGTKLRKTITNDNSKGVLTGPDNNMNSIFGAIKERRFNMDPEESDDESDKDDQDDGDWN